MLRFLVCVAVVAAFAATAIAENPTFDHDLRIVLPLGDEEYPVLPREEVEESVLCRGFHNELAMNVSLDGGIPGRYHKQEERWLNPFYLGPRVEVRDATSGLLVALLPVVDTGGKIEVQYTLVLGRYKSIDELDFTPVDVDFHGATLTLKKRKPNEAVMATYNIAHFRGSWKQWSESAYEDAGFAEYFALVFLSLQADIINMQEVPTEYNNPEFSEAHFLLPVLDAMNALEVKLCGALNSTWSMRDVSNLTTYWHGYITMSRFPLSDYVQQDPKIMQGLTAVTTRWDDGQLVRVYNNHLYYIPENPVQLEEVKAHLHHIETEMGVAWRYFSGLIYAGDFNNHNSTSPNLVHITAAGFRRNPQFYVDQTYIREPKADSEEVTITQRFMGPFTSAITHANFVASIPPFPVGAASDHIPVLSVITLKELPTPTPTPPGSSSNDHTALIVVSIVASVCIAGLVAALVWRHQSSRQSAKFEKLEERSEPFVEPSSVPFVEPSSVEATERELR